MMHARKIAKWPKINLNRDRHMSNDHYMQQANGNMKPSAKPSDRSFGLKPFSSNDCQDQEDDLTDRFVNYVHQDDEIEP